MNQTAQHNDLLAIFLENKPLLDVRAPVEFSQGAFPNAINLPLMSDQERHLVGLRYKEAGQESAIELGHQLVCGDLKAQRVQAWTTFAKAHPEGVLYCFRGGMRSQIAQRWLLEAGVAYPRVTGGYKAMRRFLLTQLEHIGNTTEFLVIGGLTGTGKTDVIQALTRVIDLEGLANHRGSSFGGHPDHQPSQIDFENALIVALLQQTHGGISQLALEDEAQLIGRCAVPDALRKHTLKAPMVWVTEDLEQRIERIERDYIRRLLTEYESRHGQEAGFLRFSAHLTRSLYNLRKRLGLQRHAQLDRLLQDALQHQSQTGQTQPHQQWIERLVTDYYDPMYAYQRAQRAVPTIFEGTGQEVTSYLKDLAY